MFQVKAWAPWWVSPWWDDSRLRCREKTDLALQNSKLLRSHSEADGAKSVSWRLILRHSAPDKVLVWLHVQTCHLVTAGHQSCKLGCIHEDIFMSVGNVGEGLCINVFIICLLVLVHPPGINFTGQKNRLCICICVESASFFLTTLVIHFNICCYCNVLVCILSLCGGLIVFVWA